MHRTYRLSAALARPSSAARPRAPSRRRAGDRVDAELLRALPPSLQMEVVTRLRDSQLVQNRAQFQDPDLDMQGFAAAQMRSYLKRTDLRREVDRVRDRMNAAAGYGIGGAAARPIASQAGRAFILQDHAEGTATSPRPLPCLAPPRYLMAPICAWHRRA